MRAGRPPLAPLFFPFAIDTQSRPGHRIESFRGDLGAAVDTDAVGAGVDSREGLVDGGEQALVGLFERVVDLAVDGLRRRVGHMLVGTSGDELPGLVLERSRVLLVEILERVDDSPPFLEQESTERLDIQAAHRESRRSASSAVRPETSTVLSRVPCPATRRRSAESTASVSARRASVASFALPRSGGAVTRSFHASPWRPTTPDRGEPGITRK